MSRVDELLRELCPEGVEFKPLEVVARLRNGKSYRSHGSGNVPVYGSGGIMTRIDTAAYDKPSVLIPRKGSLENVYYVDEPFWTVDTIFWTEIDEQLVVPKFLYYVVQSMRLAELNHAGGVPSLTQADLNRLRVPVPPLQIQYEIVQILDTLQSLVSELESELEGELKRRKLQYEYYRESYMTFEPSSVTWLPLGDIAQNLDSQRRPVTKSARVPGPYPYYGASGVVDSVGDYLFDGDYLLVSEDGANLLARTRPIAFSASGKIWVNNHAHVLQFDSYVARRFVEIYLNSVDLAPYVSAAAQPKLTKSSLDRIPVPQPPSEQQERIVDVLDRIESLVTSLSTALREELEARRKQYESYCDQVLAFKEVV